MGDDEALLLHRCALRKFHATHSQNTCDHAKSDSKSKRAWSNCVLCIPFILSGSPNECCLHTCDACVIKTWRLGLRATRGARNKSIYSSTVVIPVMNKLMTCLLIHSWFYLCLKQQTMRRIISNSSQWTQDELQAICEKKDIFKHVHGHLTWTAKYPTLSWIRGVWISEPSSRMCDITVPCNYFGSCRTQDQLKFVQCFCLDHIY